MKAEEFYEQNGYTVQRTRDLSIVMTELDAIELLEQYAELRIQQEREKWKEEAKQEVLKAIEEVDKALKRKLRDYNASTSQYEARCAVYDCINIVETQVKPRIESK